MEMRPRKIAAKGNRSTTVSPMLRSQQQPRQKAGGTSAGGTKAWLVISESGKSHIEEAGKYSIMRRTGIGAPDLRILDPMFSYPLTVLGRRRAIVVNLEHTKAIITATEVLVLRSENPQVSAFVEDLQYQLSNHYRQAVAESSDIDMGVTNKGPRCSHSFLSHDKSENPSPRKEISVESSTMKPQMKDCGPDSTLDVPKGTGAKELPFEFRVLEVCLQRTCKCLESETFLLEKEAYPALDKLTSTISPLNLERVRQIKSRLVTMSGRVKKVRDQLEHLLDNDVVMAEMYLTDKLVRRRLEETSPVSELDDGALGAEDEICENFKSKDKRSYESFGSSKRSKPNIEKLATLFEAYFTQTEGTRSKLSTLSEYVDDAEDYINLMLDDRQNQMLQMGVMLTTAIITLEIGLIVAEIFSMKIRIGVYDHGTQTQFSEATLGIGAGCLILWITVIGLFKKIGLLA